MAAFRRLAGRDLTTICNYLHGFMWILILSIYTLSDLGVLSNLIGSLSRAIQQYSPPSEWIMRNS